MSTDVIVKPEPLDLFAVFGSNKESEENGVWVDLNGVTRFKIRAFSSKSVLDLREELMKPYQTMIRAGLEIPEEKNEEIGLKVIAGGVLAGWDGVNLNGEVVPYSAEAAYILLQKLPQLANFIAQTSVNKQQFRDAAKEDGAKN